MFQVSVSVLDLFHILPDCSFLCEAMGFCLWKADEKEGRGEKEKEEMEERYKAEEEEWERSRKWQKIRKKIILRPKEVLITCLDISRIWLYNWVNYSTPPGSSLRSLICKTTVISNYQYCFDTEN